MSMPPPIIEEVSETDEGNSSSSNSSPPKHTSSSQPATDEIQDSSARNKQELWGKLEDLAALLQQGFLSEAEYRDRRVQLIDQLTGTSSSSNNNNNINKQQQQQQRQARGTSRRRQRTRPQLVVFPPPPNTPPPELGTVVVPHPPSDPSTLIHERARKHQFDLRTRTWTSKSSSVALDPTAFGRGGLRLVYHMREIRLPPKPLEVTAAMEDLTVEATGIDKNGVAVVAVGMRRDAPAPLPSPHAAAAEAGKPMNAYWASQQFVRGGGLGASGTNSQLIRTESSTTMGGTTSASTSPLLDSDDTISKYNANYNDRTQKAACPTEEATRSGHTTTTVTTVSTVAVAKSKCLVAKRAIDPDEDPGSYFRDVELQTHCAYYARLFNTYQPPRRVEFCRAWVIELVERIGSPLCAVEQYIPGAYIKHNNNYGYVSEDERNTPQAFSHFSYEASARTMIIVDIQGVGDRYTDPQIHTINGKDFGKGNLGRRGFQKFLSTHRCNSICRYLKLPSVNPRDDLAGGTVPALPFMNDQNIRRRRFQEAHYFEANEHLQKYVTARTSTSTRGGGGGEEETHRRGEAAFFFDTQEDDLCTTFLQCCSCAIL